MFIDSHCHLTWPGLRQKVGELIDSAVKVGVREMVSVGIKPGDWEDTMEIVREHGQVYGALGLHPVHAHEFEIEESLEKLDLLLDSSWVVALGEIGLDYYHYQDAASLQQDVFRRQLFLAKKKDLPVVIHTREAMEDTLVILEEFSPLAGVVHSFSGTLGQAERIIECGLNLGCNGIVTFPSAGSLSEVIGQIDLKYLWLETDAPFLAPQPVRGQSCQPAYVAMVADYIASLMGVSIEEVGRETSESVRSVLRLDRS